MIVIGDLHLKYKEPYWKAQKKFLNWLKSKFDNEEWVFLGDIYDTVYPHWEVYETFHNLVNDRKEKTYLLMGNHDFSKFKGNSLKPHFKKEVVEIIEKIAKYEINSYKCLFLSYNFSDYSSNSNLFTEDYDFVFSHLTHPKEAFGNEGVDLEFINSKYYIYGHIHTFKIYNNHIILGSPLPTRNLEIPQNILQINENFKLEYIKVPSFLKIENLKYGEEPPNKDWLYNIYDAPSFDSVYENYKDYYIREEGIKLKESNEIIKEDLTFASFSLKDKFLAFAKQENLSDDIINCFMRYYYD